MVYLAPVEIDRRQCRNQGVRYPAPWIGTMCERAMACDDATNAARRLEEPAAGPSGGPAPGAARAIARNWVALYETYGKLAKMVDRLSRSTATSVPEAVAYVRDLLDGFGAPWFLCGGWAADAWLGRQTRDHWDVDIAVFHHDQRVIFEHLAGWALVGHDPNVPGDTTEPWNGRHLDLPAHIHVPVLGSPLSTAPIVTHTAFEFEFLLNERSGDDWVLNHELRIAAPLDRCAGQSAWGVPTATPEIVLFYKAGGNLTAAELETLSGVRSHDEQDFLALLPSLTEAQRTWLRGSLAKVRPDHPWLKQLAG